jgi:hypothetical protein
MWSKRLVYGGFFWNLLYGGPWSIPKTILEITTSVSSLTPSFIS